MAAALERDRIDVALVWDSHLGFFDVADIDLRHLDQPADLPPVGGFNVSALKTLVDEDPQLAIGVGRAIARSTVYALENLPLAAEKYLAMYPEGVAAGEEVEDAARDLAVLVGYRADAWPPPDGVWGQIREEEWTNAFQLADSLPDVEGATNLDVNMFVTQSLIDEINAFDEDQVREMAR